VVELNVPAITVESQQVKLKLPVRFGVTAEIVREPCADGTGIAVPDGLYVPP
jgi:hypothetical protein